MEEGWSRPVRRLGLTGFTSVQGFQRCVFWEGEVGFAGVCGGGAVVLGSEAFVVAEEEEVAEVEDGAAVEGRSRALYCPRWWDFWSVRGLIGGKGKGLGWVGYIAC